MIKQEELREGFAVYLFWEDNPQGKWSMVAQQGYYLQKADKQLGFLQSQFDVAIKVERKLPDLELMVNLAKMRGTLYDQGVIKGIHLGRGNMLRAGYTATEPLVKEAYRLWS